MIEREIKQSIESFFRSNKKKKKERFILQMPSLGNLFSSHRNRPRNK